MKLIPVLIFIFSVLNASITGDIISGIGNSLHKTQETIQTVLTDAKNDVTNFIDTGATIIKDINQNAKPEIVPKVERVPVPQLVSKEGYPCEAHKVTTSDGYILEIHRIPNGKSGKKNDKVVLLQHGLLAASSDWVLFGPEHGLAYKLADEGYDVWMGNFRGNLYSRKHKDLDPEKDMIKFWAFSWHEMGTEDLPAMTDYILEKTNHSSIYYIGHDQGTTVSYVTTSMKPEYNNKFKAIISMAPMAYMGNLFSPLLRIIALRTAGTESLWQLIGNNEFMPNSGLIDSLSDGICAVNIGKVLCKNSLFAISGFSPKQMNTSSLPLITAHYPAGASTKQVLHYVQEINSRRFCNFDYGPLNLVKYKFVIPPAYNLDKITAPVILMYSHNDWLSAESDVLQLFKELGNGKEKYRIEHSSWNHLDYIFGKDAPTVVYNKIVEYLDKY